MRRIRSVLLAVALLATAAVPAHADWSIGANLGMNIFMPNDDAIDNTTTFGWPISPGLRVGFGSTASPHEFYALTELTMASSGDASASSFFLSGNYQYNFASSGNSGLYVTGGAGIDMVRFEDDFGPPIGSVDASATSFIFGGGVGLRHRMGNGHGVLRGEVRLDVQGEGEDSGTILIDEGNLFSIRLGFDLWD